MNYFLCAGEQQHPFLQCPAKVNAADHAIAAQTNYESPKVRPKRLAAARGELQQLHRHRGACTEARA